MVRARFFLLLIVTPLLALPVRGQQPDNPLGGGHPDNSIPWPVLPEADQFEIGGSVYDREGPVAGAKIALESRTGTSRQTTTDDRGRFNLVVQGGGRWEVVVTGEGYAPSNGFLVVRPDVGSRLDVELRRLDERTPGFAEDNPQATVEGWLERGNALLDQGRTTEARQEYEKALALLEPEERAAVLRAVARTYYLEQRSEEAVETLWQSVMLSPDSSDSRQLYLGLMSNLGREQEAQEKLGRLDDDPPIKGPVTSGSAPMPARQADLSAPEPASRDRTGPFVVRFDERSPLGLVATVDRRYGLPEDWSTKARDYPPSSESFSVHVPEAYGNEGPIPEASSEESGWGLLVWVSPTPRGAISRPNNLTLLSQRRMLWIGANQAGNQRPFWERIGLALDAAQEMQRYYEIDPERIYVGGYSGGGRLATALALLWPEVFRGGIAWFGSSWWEAVAVPYKPGHSWPPAFKRPDRKAVEGLREHGRISLVTGDLDFNRSETNAIHRSMLEEGITGVEYFQIPNADHYHGVDPIWLGRALDHLDSD